MNEEIKKTPFTKIYDSFLSRVSDSMYMEITELDTFEMLQDLLLNSLFRFEFPRVDITDYNVGTLSTIGKYKGIESEEQEIDIISWTDGYFNLELTSEEINIISLNMVIEWLGQQLATTENTRMKYSGSDFKFTSQANHMAKLQAMLEKYIVDSKHLQRLYERRKLVDGRYRPTAGIIVSTPEYGYNVEKEISEWY